MTTFYLIITFGYYLLLTKLKNKINKTWINPLLFASLLIIATLKILNLKYDYYYESVSFISYLLTPATVALAIPLYENKSLIKKHAPLIFVSILSGILVHSLSLVFLKLLLNFDPLLFKSTIAKSVTTAIAKDITLQLGGLSEITVPLVIITGIFGAAIADSVFKYLKVESKIAAGLALGVSAHAVGTSKAIEMGEVEASMSSIALILTGLLTVLLAPIILWIFL